MYILNTHQIFFCCFAWFFLCRFFYGWLQFGPLIASMWWSSQFLASGFFRSPADTTFIARPARWIRTMSRGHHSKLSCRQTDLSAQANLTWLIMQKKSFSIIIVSCSHCFMCAVHQVQAPLRFPRAMEVLTAEETGSRAMEKSIKRRPGRRATWYCSHAAVTSTDQISSVQHTHQGDLFPFFFFLF